jgi:hypothetical protein
MAKRDIQALYETSMRLIQGEQVTDPIKRLFNSRKLSDGARLRRLYAEHLQTTADVQALAEQIAAAEYALRQVHARLLGPAPAVEITTPMPTPEDCTLYASLQAEAILIEHRLGAWKKMTTGVELRRSDAARAWDLALADWRETLWRLTGDVSFAPAMRIATPDNPSGWIAPGAQQPALEARLRQLEA